MSLFDEAWRYRLTIGSDVDALDTNGTWYYAKVIGANQHAVRIHYPTFSDQYDETLPRTSPRLSAFRTRAMGAGRPHGVQDAMYKQAQPTSQSNDQLIHAIIALESRVSVLERELRNRELSRAPGAAADASDPPPPPYAP